MEINAIVSQLKDKFGDKINVTAIKEKLSGVDTSKLSFAQIVEKVKPYLGDLDGDGKVESTFQELKGKAASMVGSIFHR